MFWKRKKSNIAENRIRKLFLICFVICFMLLFAGISVASATTTSGWETEKAVVAGTHDVLFSISCAGFNLTGDAQWTLISGDYMGLLHAHYWNGTQWVYDTSRLKGLPEVAPGAFGIGWTSGTYAAPAMAFNLTGDGTWTLIAKNSDGDFFGYYWNGTQWIEDALRVNGLSLSSGRSALTLINNLTGDGNWTLITGSDTNWFGYYWNGTQWIEDAFRVAGLPALSLAPRPSASFNLTGDGNWTLIYTLAYGGFYGYYWNGTQWVEDVPRVKGIKVSGYDLAPTLIDNLRGDGKWVLISGQSDWYYLGYTYDTVVVEEMQPAKSVTSYNPRATTVHITGTHNRTWDHRVKYSINADLSNASWSQWFNDVDTFDTKVHYLQPDTTYYYQVYTYLPWDHSYYATTSVQTFATLSAQMPIQVNPGESIQEALDTLPLEGGTVELLSGEWNIAETIHIDRDNITLKGTGMDQTRINMSTPDVNIIECEHVDTSTQISNITIERIHLHGAGSDKKHGILFTNVLDSTVSEIWVEQCGYSGIGLSKSENNVVRNCKCNDQIQGIYLSRSNNNTIINNTCFNNSYTNIALNSGNSDNKILNNTLWGKAGGRGALSIYSSSYRNLIEGNTIYQSSYGGISIWHTCRDNIVVNNTIYANNHYGIEVYYECDRTIIKNNLIFNSNQYGIWIDGAIACLDTNIESNTIYGNGDDGIFIETGANTTIKNNIIVNNGKYGIEDKIHTTTSSYNDAWNNDIGNYYGAVGIGNTEVDPLFADPANGDFHLKSQAGRWNGTAWVNDSVTSPCIDAGDPADDYSNEPSPNGGRINMGAYGNTGEASKSSGATGTISGTVKNTSFNSIEGATLSTNGYSNTTNSTGQYRITLPVGNYTVTASKTGYQSQSKPAEVKVNQTTIVNFTLTVATTTTTTTTITTTTSTTTTTLGTTTTTVPTTTSTTTTIPVTTTTTTTTVPVTTTTTSTTTVPITSTTTTLPVTTTTTLPVTTTTSTTTTLPCTLPGDYPECGEVTLAEVVDFIVLWSQGLADLEDVINLINAWAEG